jgi:hypothetical protein
MIPDAFNFQDKYASLKMPVRIIAGASLNHVHGDTINPP